MNGAQFVDQKSCYLCGCTSRWVEQEVGTGLGELKLRWVRCAECSLVYLDPRPSSHALSVFYDSAGYWRGGENGYRDYLADEPWRRRQAAERARWMMTRLRAHRPQSPFRVLEVGSAAGYFLEALSAEGARVEGLELSQSMARLAGRRASGRVPVRQGLVQDADFAPESFDGLAVWGCDSNFDDPQSTFQRFSDWLVPGGLLAMNFHQHDHWARHLKGRFKMMPNALYLLNTSHVVGLLESAGFELIEKRTESQWMSLSSIYHHTGHPWLKPLLRGALADRPIRLPVLGSYRILARKSSFAEGAGVEPPALRGGDG